MNSIGKKRVLIVEDVDEMRFILSMTLDATETFQASAVARNGWEARLELSRNRPDLVLMDEVLPGESSWDLIKAFFETSVPVILMTSMDEAKHEMSPEAKGRLMKPMGRNLQNEAKILEAATAKLLGASTCSR